MFLLAVRYSSIPRASVLKQYNEADILYLFLPISLRLLKTNGKRRSSQSDSAGSSGNIRETLCMLFFIGVFDSLKLFQIYRKTPQNLFFLFFSAAFDFFSASICTH